MRDPHGSVAGSSHLLTYTGSSFVGHRNTIYHTYFSDSYAIVNLVRVAADQASTFEK